MRLDQWLWAVRVFKTRTRSAESIRAGHVLVNGAPSKPAHDARSGEIISARCGLVTRTLRVLGAPASRVGAKLVGEFAEELTPAEELSKGRHEPNLLPPGFRPRGAGRPTKRDRRRMDQALE